jgi:pimeloyl-ACP methyl ester carboxylesterase
MGKINLSSQKKNAAMSVLAGIFVIFLTVSCGSTPPEILSIQEQGAFSAGGKVITSEGTFDPYIPWFQPQGGQTRHGDHADVFYQIPVNAKDNALIFLHGYGQSRRSWETTADGREGFANIFLRQGYSVYLVDQPGRGEAGQTTVPGEITAIPDDQTWFTQFRIGLWPDFNAGVQFPQDEKSLDQFFRMMTPDTGRIDQAAIVSAISAVFDRSGSGILFTHSAGGMPGWETAMANSNVKAVVAFEPGGFPFPRGEVPDGFPGGPDAGIPLENFKKLAEIPVIVYFGDYIPEGSAETAAFSQIFWRSVLDTAKRWSEVVKAHGGDVTIVHLPEIGITGNTHFIMSDLNNREIADHLEKWFCLKRLNQ